MKNDYSLIFQELKAKGLIGENDVCLACKERPGNGLAIAFGLIGAAIASSGLKYYYLAANESGLKLFEMSKPGIFLGNIFTMPRADIIKVKAGKLIGGMNITVKTRDFTHKLVVSNKFYGFEQKENVKKAYEILKTYSR